MFYFDDFMEILNFEIHLNQITKLNVPQNQNKDLKEAEELRGAAEEVKVSSDPLLI